MKKTASCRAFLALVFLILPFRSALQGAEIVPVGDFRFLGGQYFFDTNPSSLSGNLSFTIVPAIKFSDSFSLVPTYMGNYRGTKEVNDLAGGGTLFQDSQSHLLSVKGIYTVVPPLKLKLGASYRLEYLRETANENWGKGLFDYRKFNTGFEAEYAFTKKHSVRVGIDYFTLQFPNYESLESSVTEGELGRELAGKNTLNCANLMTVVKLNDTFGPVRTELGFGMTGKNYADQPLVLPNGDLSAAKRNDTYSLANANATWPLKISPVFAVIPVLDLQYAMNDSNQAHYDAKTPRYIPEYYDYTYLAVGPAVHLLCGKLPVIVTLGTSLNTQNYAQRLAQDAGGKYLDDKISVNETIISFGITYPVKRNFKLRLIGSVIDATSNMKYENTFAYNYQTSNYLMGFSYEF